MTYRTYTIGDQVTLRSRRGVIAEVIGPDTYRVNVGAYTAIAHASQLTSVPTKYWADQEDEEAIAAEEYRAEQRADAEERDVDPEQLDAVEDRYARMYGW